MLDDKEHTLVTMANLGEVYNKLRRYDEAEPLLADAVVTARRSLQQGHWLTGELLIDTVFASADWND